MNETAYNCPGEAHPISRPVHLARLASHFAGCRDCAFRFDQGQLPVEAFPEQATPNSRRKSLFDGEGLCGVYLNELTRKQAHLAAAALGDLLWQQRPRKGFSRAEASRAEPRRPHVLIAGDDRPAAPDLLIGAAAGLRRMGCRVLDLGHAVKPAFWFAANHLQVDAGVFINGAGLPPARMRIDFAGFGGRPLSSQERSGTSESRLSLTAIEANWRDPYQPATRQSGSLETLRDHVSYQAGLRKHFRGIRPHRVVLATGSRLMKKTLTGVYSERPAELVLLELAQRVRHPLDPADGDVLQLASAVREQRADLGVLIDDDGQRCAFTDETGQLVSLTQTTRLIAEVKHADFPSEPIILEEYATAELEVLLKRAGMRVARTGRSLSQMYDAMRGHHASFGGGASGRYWFREAVPTSDAIIALAAVLTAMNRSRQPLSQLV